jgi:hypothetical protein
MAKPTDFFLGITDLFSVLLPGACIAFVGLKVAEHRPTDLLGKLGLSAYEGYEGYIAFFVVAYLLGHLMDYGGSQVWDEGYDRMYARRKRSRALKRAEELLKTRSETSEEGRVAVKIREAKGDRLLFEATRLAESSMPAGDRVYQWSRTWSCLRNPTAFIEIERMQANSKFFRGLISVFLIASIVLLWMSHSDGLYALAAGVCVLLGLTSFLRFCDLRWKAVQQTYRFFIASLTEPAELAAAVAGEHADDDN